MYVFLLFQTSPQTHELSITLQLLPRWNWSQRRKVYVDSWPAFILVATGQVQTGGIFPTSPQTTHTQALNYHPIITRMESRLKKKSMAWSCRCVPPVTYIALHQDTEFAHTSLIKRACALQKSGPAPKSWSRPQFIRAGPIFVDFCKFGKFSRKEVDDGRGFPIFKKETCWQDM